MYGFHAIEAALSLRSSKVKRLVPMEITMFELQRLRDKCLIAFEKYAQEAQKTCELVGNLEDNSDLLDRLLAVMEQTNVEDQAQRTYVLLRQQLFNVLADIEAPCILEATVPEEDAGDATQ